MTTQNQLLPWATGAGANVLSPSEFAADDDRQQGFQRGIGRSIVANTAIRHATFAASMIGLFTSARADVDVLDDGDVDGFRDNFEAALLAYFQTQVPGNIYHFGADTSATANHLTVPTIFPASGTRHDGFTVSVRVQTSVTGDGVTPVTLSVGGDTAKNIVRPDGTNVRTGDLLAGQVATFVFDGTKYFMASPNAASFSGGGGGGGSGSPGASGADGTKFYAGDTDPASGLGVNGDFYFNKSTFDLFQRTSGTWGVLCNLKGADAVIPSAITLNASTTLTTAQFDYEVKLSAAGTFTTTLPTPAAKGGVGRFHIYNAASVAMTLATPSGSFVGPHGSGALSMSIPAGSTVFVISDNTNWVTALTRATANNAYANGDILATFTAVPSALDGDDGDFTMIAGSFQGAVDGVYRKASGAWAKLCSLPRYLTANPVRVISGSTAVGSVYCIDSPAPRPPSALSLSDANLNNQGLVLSGGASVGAGAGLPSGTWKIRRVIGVRSVQFTEVPDTILTAICERIA